MDFLCNLPAAQLNARWKNLEFLENFGSRSCHVSQLHKISQLPQLHKNLTIAAAAHGTAHSQLHKKFDSRAPAPLQEGEEPRLHARETQLENSGMEISGRRRWKNLEELEKFGI